MSGQYDLFGDARPARRPIGLELGHAAAERAADHAGEAWKEKAYAAFQAHARGHARFTTEDVRQASPTVGDPPDKRAWGQVAMRARKAGIVRSAGWVSAKDPKVHGNAVTLWESV